MVDAIREYLDQEMVCEGLLECMFGLKRLDREVFVCLTDHAEPLTVDEIATEVGRERSTAYRSVQRLIDTGFVQKEQINYEQGGYCHVFRPTDPDEIADDMQRLLNDWYARMARLVEEFNSKYETATSASTDD
ncbi:MAG: helix-turn-helix domain-containing protein [Halohasta sp.]